MEWEKAKERSNMDQPGDKPKGHWLVLLFAMIYGALFISTAVFGSSWGSYKGLTALWFASYFILVYLIFNHWKPQALAEADPKYIIAGMLLLSLLLYLPFFLREPTLSQDILRLERRGELLMDGSFPYRDFEVNKPPLYIWMVGLISLPFGPRQFIFRLFFIIAGSFIPVLIFLIYRNMKGGQKEDQLKKGDMKFEWLKPAIAYILCPIPILEIGLGGHFDPLVVLTVLGSFYFLLKKRSMTAGILLGAAFALKLYPMFIAPLFFLSFPRWRDRWTFTAGFFLPTFLSALPLLIVKPALLLDYMQYQFYGWSTGTSIRGALEAGLQQIGLPLGGAYYIVTGLLLLSTIYFILQGIKGRISRVNFLPVIIPLMIFSIIGAVLQMVYLSEYEGGLLDTSLGLIGIGSSAILSGVGLYLFLNAKDKNERKIDRIDPKKIFMYSIHPSKIPILSASILIILILTSAQFHPWYLMWPLPFLLISESSSLAWSALLFFSSFQINGYLPWDV